MISYFALLKRQLHREIRLNLRQFRSIIHACLFFFMVMIFFPLSMPADAMLLRTMVPGLVWIAMLLALFLSAERLFQQDFDDGVIEQWLVSGYPVSVMICAKILIHWFLNLLPVLLLCPLLAIIFALDGYEVGILMLSLVCGSLTILTLCTLAAAFGTSLKQKSILMALILLPLAIPVMIFGSGAVIAAMQHLNVSGHLALLLAMSLSAIVFLPFAIAAVIRINLID
jgi:heme exporter protein B